MSLVLFVILIALVFEYINGFHDTANSIATVVSTRSLSPRAAILLAACFNLLGALAGVAVAKTIGSGIVEAQYVSLSTIAAALLGAIGWNLITWYVGLPSSSSHALIGGLCGAALATSHGNWHALKWDLVSVSGHAEGLWPKVILPMILSPAAGFTLGFIIMLLMLAALKNLRPHRANRLFSKCQWLSASYMSLSHGMNDAQKTMGIIALTLCTATNEHIFDTLPRWLAFLRTPDFDIALWVKVTCALTMAAGTAAGGYRIIKTLGHKMVKMQPVHGFAAETASATVIQIASHWGIPVSTTHVISSSIMGMGSARRFNSVKWGVVEQMAWAWIFTLPVCGLFSYGVHRVMGWLLGI
ncbi:MAG: inorganic phosphate transporter [Verrucomicrobiales bacterium]|jgi:PiT family inorganic phosphate transporter|nr:inorganic phosphate transporter [Verrucomicrobiales bacterium]